MSTTNKKDLLAKIKAAFLGEPATSAPAPPAAPTTPTPCAYPVDGGPNVVVDISDDGLPDIDQGDKVYSDTAMTTPYPDGTYNVTGTTFGFTVAGGIVSAVSDPTAAGPGTPVDAAMAAPVTAPVPPAPTFEERLAALEAKVGAVPAGMATEVQLQEATAQFASQKDTIAKHEKTITDLFALVETLLGEPTADPVTLTDAQKAKFKKVEDKEARFNRFAQHIKDNKVLN